MKAESDILNGLPVLVFDQKVNTVRDDSNHTQRHWGTFTEWKYVKQSLSVSGHFNEVVKLQKC